MPAFPASSTRRHFLQGVAGAAAGALVPAAAGADAPHGLPPRAWWPEWRHDGRRSGCSELAGAIAKPAEHWRYFLGAPPAGHVEDASQPPPSDTHDLDGRGGAYRVALAADAVLVLDARTGSAVWRHPLKARPLGYHPPVVAKLDPARAGLQVVVWPVDGNFYGPQGDRALCFAFDQGVRAGHVLWTVEPPVGQLHAPNVMAAPVRPGAGLDVVVIAWDGITVWDGATGRLEQRVDWPAVRQYGLSTCFRLPGDDALWVVNLADYVPHIHVARLGTGSEPGKLVWSRHYLKTNQTPDMLFRVRPSSVADLDGDGVPEIACNLYNVQRDLQWHLVVFALRTGQVLVDQPDCFAVGVEDLDGDGRPELLCTHVGQVDPHVLGELSVRRLAGGTLPVLWSLPDARFLLGSVRGGSPATINGASEGSTTAFVADADGDGVREFLVERDTDGDRLTDRFEAYALDRRGGVRRRWHYAVPPGQALEPRVYQGGGKWQFADLARGDLVTLDARGQEIARARGQLGGFATVPVAADIDGDGRCEIALVNSRREVEVLAAPRAGRRERVTLRWKRRGQAMPLYQAYTFPTLTLGLADVDGDGTVEVLYAGESRDGTATLAAGRPDGRVLWEHVFPGVGTDGIYSGVTRWFTGRFLGHRGHDVGVVTHRFGNGSNLLWLLDGRTGHIAWGPVSHVPVPGSRGQSSVGTRLLQAVHDFDGDGKDDIAFHEVWYTLILSGPTGKPLHGKGVIDTYGRTLNYAYLMLGDVDGDGRMDLVLHGPLMHTMAQTATMQKLWFRDWNSQANHFPPALARLDGRLVLGMPGEDGVFRCVQAADGNLLWEEKIGHPGASSVGAADVDGDGSPEFFYLDKAGQLVVVRGKVRPGQSRLLWAYPVGPGQHPIFADVDGDGKGEFLLVTDDGYLRCIGPA